MLNKSAYLPSDKSINAGTGYKTNQNPKAMPKITEEK
jgi:hypothetical protein